MKLTKITTLLLASSLLLTSCSSNKQQSSNKDKDLKGKEITLMIPDWGAPTQNLLDEFKNETGITVHVQKVGWDDIKKKVSVASSAKNAPADLFEVDWSWAGEFKSAGWLEKLNIPQDVQKDIPSLKYFSFNNDTYALPYSNDLRLAYMNQDMMNKAGIKNNPKNWNELETVFEKMKTSNTVKYPLLFPLTAEEKTTTSFMTLAYTRNSKIFNNDGTLNKGSTLDTLKLIEKMLKKGYINPNSTSTPGIDIFNGIQNANGAFLEGPTSFVTSVNDKKESKVVDKVKAIPVPGKNAKATKSIAFIEAIGISSFSKNKEAAKKFIEWYYQPKTQIKLNKNIYLMPTRTSVLKKMIDNKEIKAPSFVVEQSKNVDCPFPNGVPKYYTKMSTEIFNIIHQLGENKLNAEQATNKMVNKVNQIVKENK